MDGSARRDPPAPQPQRVAWHRDAGAAAARPDLEAGAAIGGAVAIRSIAAGPEYAAGCAAHEAIIRHLSPSDDCQAKPYDTALNDEVLRRRAPSYAKLASAPAFRGWRIMLRWMI